MTTSSQRLTAAIMALALPLASIPAPTSANVGSSMDSFLNDVGGAANVNGPTAFQGQSAGYYIRQSVLEGLGWRIYRVWSTDWFADPARETAKLINWLDGIRDKLVSQLGPLNALQTLTASAGELLSSPPPGQDLAADDVVSKSDDFSLDNSGNEDVVDTRQPVGRKLRMVDDIQPYEAVPGLKYELWKLDDFLGEVEVIKRATASPRLYGGQVQIPKSEYEGRVASTGDRFISYDLYAAIREVARRSVDKDNEG